jgi:biopolymer transport protein ExbD
MAFSERRRDAGMSLTPAGENALVWVADGSGIWSPLERLRERMRKRRSKYYCRMDPSALAGIFWALFVVLLVAQPSPHYHRWAPVDMPFKVQHSTPLPGARREDTMFVSVLRDGQSYFGSRKITPDELPELIRDGLRGGAENRIYISADARAKYSDVKAILVRVREAGVERVAFLIR